MSHEKSEDLASVKRSLEVAIRALEKIEAGIGGYFSGETAREALAAIKEHGNYTEDEG